MEENQQKQKHVRKSVSKAEVNDDRVMASITCWNKLDWCIMDIFG